MSKKGVKCIEILTAPEELGHKDFAALVACVSAESQHGRDAVGIAWVNN